MSVIRPDKKLYIFDMDGTIYLGDRVFPFAVEYIRRLRADGRRVLFLPTTRRETEKFISTGSAVWAFRRARTRS
ncbi:MAG: hypothetical protein IJU75_04980 [Clostridia bacterium]|nr:hypothetical protein [Clostridia bacterium]